MVSSTRKIIIDNEAKIALKKAYEIDLGRTKTFLFGLMRFLAIE